MSQRTNEFQQLVKYIYSRITPSGGSVTESALIRDNDGAEREIDVLIEYTVAGHEIRIAVECRDHRRSQTVEWIDSLIGKYSRLKIDKIVAISSSVFSNEAKRKAADHNIELFTINEALENDWLQRIESWKIMTHSFTLMRIAVIDKSGNRIAETKISENGKDVNHCNELSEYFYNVLKPFFMAHLSKVVAKTLEDKIGEKWQHYIDDPTPRWAEFTLHDPKISRFGEPMNIAKAIFGVGTFFHVASPSGKHFALKEYALSKAKMKLMNTEHEFRIVTDRSGVFVSIDGSLVDKARPDKVNS